MQPEAATSGVAARREAIFKQYRFSPCDISATIIWPADFSESTDAWQDILAGVAVEITRASWAEMLSTRAVKRIAPILKADENHEK